MGLMAGACASVLGVEDIEYADAGATLDALPYEGGRMRPDARLDARLDARPDAGLDAGLDASHDADAGALDAGVDAETADAGADVFGACSPAEPCHEGCCSAATNGTCMVGTDLTACGTGGICITCSATCPDAQSCTASCATGACVIISMP
jgi:hypothetical protein